MSKFKKIITGVICLLLVLIMAAPAFASEAGNGNTFSKKEIKCINTAAESQLVNMSIIKGKSVAMIARSAGSVSLENGKRLTWAKALKAGYVKVINLKELLGTEILTYVSKHVKTITISDDITNISAKAFYKCTKLTSVIFSKSSKLKKVGEYAFAYCTKIKSIKFPQKVKTIEGNVFRGCINLQSVNISKNTFINGAAMPAKTAVYYY